jgi:hypothetical protein
MLRASHLLPAIEVQAWRAGTQATVFITMAYRPRSNGPFTNGPHDQSSTADFPQELL